MNHFSCQLASQTFCLKWILKVKHAIIYCSFVIFLGKKNMDNVYELPWLNKEVFVSLETYKVSEILRSVK